jgi:hypothetical protein
MPRKLRKQRHRVRHWSDPFTGDLAPARKRFQQTYGFAHDDKQRVDEVINSLFRRYGDEHDDQIEVDDVTAALLADGDAATTTSIPLKRETVPIPVVLVQALLLRGGFGRGRGRGHLRNERAKKPAIIAAVHEAQKLEQKYRITHRHRYTTTQQRREAAAKEIAQKRGDVTAEQILAKDNWQGRRRRSRAQKNTNMIA